MEIQLVQCDLNLTLDECLHCLILYFTKWRQNKLNEKNRKVVEKVREGYGGDGGGGGPTVARVAIARAFTLTSPSRRFFILFCVV